jgi:hypothetical protein
VYLDWQTSSEHDNDFFLVERSKDGQTFETFLKIDGAGTTTQALKYQAIDTHPYHGTMYYRLSQADFDGSISYFKVISVRIETFAESVTKLYPNHVDRDDEINMITSQKKMSSKNFNYRSGWLRYDSGMIDAKEGVNVFRFTPNFKRPGVHVLIIRLYCNWKSEYWLLISYFLLL